MSSFSAKSPPHRRPVLPLDFSALSALGLLLVNFFMLQSLWQKPQVLPLALPDYAGCTDGLDWNKAHALTLLCGREKVYAYIGLTDPKLDSVDYSPAGLRRLILCRKQSVDAQFGPNEYKAGKSALLTKGSYTNILIKALPSARYGNIVYALNEMNVCGIQYYALLDIQPEDIAFVQDPGRGLCFITH